MVAQSGQPLDIGDTRIRALTGEHGGRHRGAGGERGAGVLADALRGPVGAAVLVEAREIEAEVAGALPQVRVVEAPLVGVQGVGERPERVLAGGGFRKGYAHGTTDAQGQAPATEPCTPDDVASSVMPDSFSKPG